MIPFRLTLWRPETLKRILYEYTNLEDPDKMSHDAAFYQSLHCLLRINRTSEKEIHFFWNSNISPIKLYNGPAWLRRDSWLLYFNCLPGVLWQSVFYGSTSLCCGFVCSVRMWCFPIILTFLFGHSIGLKRVKGSDRNFLTNLQIRWNLTSAWMCIRPGRMSRWLYMTVKNDYSDIST